MKADMTAEQWAFFMEANPCWWGGVPKERRMAARTMPGQLAIIPYAESMYILKHGKKAWRAWRDGKAEQEPFLPMPTMPTESR